MTDTLERDAPAGSPASPVAGSSLRTVLLAVIAVAALVLAVGAGYLLRGGSDSASAGAPSAVDIGFAQDMSTHHTQAVTMAGIERDNSSDKALKVLAFDIETGQNFQLGQMAGWLGLWNEPRNNPDEMAWMGHDHMSMGSSMGADGLMPGMATAAQMDALTKAKGKALDILFLQLMIRHHQGGIPMAQYALEHAKLQVTRDLAQSMINAQNAELLQMEQSLRQLGGSPLPAPN